jgi:hypothetical protein
MRDRISFRCSETENFKIFRIAINTLSTNQKRRFTIKPIIVMENAKFAMRKPVRIHAKFERNQFASVGDQMS